MRATIALIITTLCLVPAMQLLAPVTAVENISYDVYWFGGGGKTALIDFQSPGADDSTNISVQTGMIIDDARMNISTVPQEPGSTSYPSNLTVDFGRDGSTEWQWRGKGYGDWGRQDVFMSGADNSTIVFGMNASITSYFALPKGAEVLSANCTLNGSSTSSLVVPAGGSGGSTNVFPFGSGSSVRFQWLYLPGEINTAGQVAMLGWKVQPNYGIGGSATLSNFKLKLCNTTITGLTTTFDTNYGGAAPVTVIDAASYVISESGGYVWVDPPETFFYDNSKSLLIEVSFNGRVGTSFGLNVGQAPGETGARRIWNMGDYQASTGSIDGYAYRYECKMEFVTKLEMSVDLLNDSSVEFSTQDKDWGGVNLEFAQALSGFMATAPVNFTDSQGTEFVAVPLQIYMLYSGKMIFSGLSVTYKYTALIDEIRLVGGLEDVLSELMSSKLGTENNTIPIVLNSESTGQVRLTDLYIKISPPSHKPTINSFYPAATTVVKENSRLDFGIDVVDWYGNPMKIKWFSDGVEVPDATETTYSRSFDYESAGNHTVKVAINNGLSTAEQSWALTVLNVNRAPALAEYQPPADPTIDENQTQAFRMNATDPDKDPLSYKWMLNGKVQPAATCNTFLLSTNYMSAGDHTVKVTATDPGGLWVGRNWTVHVNNVNLPPTFLAWSPKTNPRILEKESAQFSVTPYDADGQTLVTTWYIDDVQAFVGNPFVYITDYKSAGVHRVRATVSDGKETTSRTWDLTVLNVNRIPVAVIDAPTDSEFMDGTAIRFSALSSYDPDNEVLAYSWREGNVNVSDQAEFERAFPPGLHQLTLEVRDKSGGVSSASVRFRVRFVEITALIGVDRLEIVAGDKVEVIITLSNTGDAPASEVGLEVLVDGQSIGTKTYGELAAGGGAKDLFNWKAVRGTHTITAKVGEQSWTREVTVQKAPEVKSTNDMGAVLWPAMIILVAVGLVAFGAVALRRK